MARYMPTWNLENRTLIIWLNSTDHTYLICYTMLSSRWYPVLRNVGEAWCQVIIPGIETIVMNYCKMKVCIFDSPIYNFTSIDSLLDIWSVMNIEIKQVLSELLYEINWPIVCKSAEVNKTRYDVIQLIWELITIVDEIILVEHAYSHCRILWK